MHPVSSWDDMWCMDLSSSCCAEMNIHIDLRQLSQRISVVSSRSQATCTVFCGTRDSYGGSEVEMGFISSWFGVHWAILHSWGASVFISFCDNVPGDSLVYHQENRGSLRVWLGKRDCSACNAGELSLISQWGGCLKRFLELRQEPGV